MKLGIWIRLKIAILSLSIATGCVAEPHNEQKKPYKITVKDQSLFFDGRLLGSAADDLQRQLDMKTQGRIQKIIIRSAGGNADVATKVGNIVNDNHLDVEVLDYCTSGCASNVFVAGDRKILAPNSIVVFHSTMPALHKVLANSQIPRAAEVFSTLAKDELALYEKLGVDDRLLMGPIYGMIPICFLEDTTKSKSDPVRYGISYTYAAWMPSLEVIEAAGVENIEGSWPKNGVEARKRSSRHFNEAFTINYIETDWPETKLTEKLERCGA